MKTIDSILEFDQIKDLLCNYAVTDTAKEKLTALAPFLNEGRLLAALQDTEEARKIIDTVGNPPLAGIKEMPAILTVAEKGGMLLPGQLTGVLHFIAACRRLRSYLKKAEVTDAGLAYIGASMDPLDFLFAEIDSTIQGETVDSNATKDLREIRRKMESITIRIKSQLEDLLKKKRAYCSDGFISMRSGHFTVPVKKEYRLQVPGMVIDTSSTGATCFIEPSSVVRLKEELTAHESAESAEVNKILYTLTALVDDCRQSIVQNMEAIETLDFAFAKGKLSLSMKAAAPQINTCRRLCIKGGRHPLLKQSDCVPLDFSFHKGTQGVVITGPNTGGKTVALKTVGLFSLMAQSGLHLPCESADICMNSTVLCDIGDGQSISENLSTFSAHLTNILSVLGKADRESLVLLDELGSGTDPAEGMGIAVAILEELQKTGCLFLATTHYPEVKEYARKTNGLTNARMTFDRESLRPLYRLEIGEAGESCALYIAKRLGLPRHMLECAYAEAYGVRKPGTGTAPGQEFLETTDEGAAVLKNAGAASAVVAKTEIPVKSTRAQRFRVGDSVMVFPKKQIGIVFRTADEKGEIGVQIQKVKKFVNHKRLQLKTAAAELYPEDYDFSIVFDSVEKRKAHKAMEKGHVPGLEIKQED